MPPDMPFLEYSTVLQLAYEPSTIICSLSHLRQGPVVSLFRWRARVSGNGWRQGQEPCWANHMSAPIFSEYGLAEYYRVKPRDNRFYFFDLFSKQERSSVFLWRIALGILDNPLKLLSLFQCITSLITCDAINFS